MPHDVQESDGDGTGAGKGQGDAAGAAWINCGLISPSLAPQTPQNFSSRESGLVQEAQVRMTTGTAAGGGVDGDSSNCEAPQFRQNFAVGATRLPHSGQYDMVSRTMKLNPLSYEDCFRKKRMGKIRDPYSIMAVCVVVTRLNIPYEGSQVSFLLPMKIGEREITGYFLQPAVHIFLPF